MSLGVMAGIIVGLFFLGLVIAIILYSETKERYIVVEEVKEEDKEEEEKEESLEMVKKALESLNLPIEYTKADYSFDTIYTKYKNFNISLSLERIQQFSSYSRYGLDSQNLYIGISENKETPISSDKILEDIRFSTHTMLANSIENVLESIDKYNEHVREFESIKNNFKDSIILDDGNNIRINYNNIPIYIGRVREPFIENYRSIPYCQDYFTKVYTRVIRKAPDYEGHYCSNYEELKEIKTSKELAEALDTIENNLLYKLSNLMDALRSMTDLNINGYSLNKEDVVISEDYTIHLNYSNGLNNFKFDIKPFEFSLQYTKNGLKPKDKYFEDYKVLLKRIKGILEESKSMLPFKHKEVPDMVYNNITGKVELDDSKALPFKEV